MVSLTDNAVVRAAESAIAAHAARRSGIRVIFADDGEASTALRARVAKACGNTEARVLVAAPHGAGYDIPSPAEPVWFPKKCYAILNPGRKARYKRLSGGRGSGKSWSIALMLLLLAVSRRVRVLCAREFQKSIAESSHRLLSDQIEALGLQKWFDVGSTSISAHNGSEFLFEGVFANASKLKSLEGVSICWIEEAAKVSSLSWEILIPTVRVSGSYFVVNFNPEQPDDPCFERFVTNPPPNCIGDHVTWLDNPFFPAPLQQEMEYLRSRDDDAFRHVWMGECRKHSAAQILAGKYVIEDFTPQPHWNGPYQGIDFGFSQDPTVMTRCWIADSCLYVEHEAWGVQIDIDRTPGLFDSIPSARAYVSRADCARPETISYLRAHSYPNVVGCEKWSGSVEDGVAFLRQFQRIVVHTRCPRTADECRKYSYKVDRLTQDVLPDIVDQFNHCLDSIRYALEPLIKAGQAAALIEFYRDSVGQSVTGAPAAAAKPETMQQRVAREGVVIRTSDSPWHQPDGGIWSRH